MSKKERMTPSLPLIQENWRGFKLTFDNGNTVSVQFSPDNYCTQSESKGNGYSKSQCPDAEIAAWDKNNNWYRFGGDEVMGWVTPDYIASFIAFVSTSDLTTDYWDKEEKFYDDLVHKRTQERWARE